MAGNAERVLITGGTGFLGACLTRDLIAAGADVHLILRPGSDTWRLAGVEHACRVHRADLRDGPAVARAVAECRPEVVYHVAAYGVLPSQKGRSAIVATNLIGLANLLDALDGHDYRALVNTGTGAEYGPRDEPIREGDRLEPRTDYAVAKAAATLFCQAEAHKGRPATTVRIFAAYGPWEDPGRLVPYVMGCCLRGESPRLSAGLQRRDFIHVEDVVALLRAAAGEPRSRGQILHAGTGNAHSVREAVGVILSVCGGGRVAAQFGAEAVRAGEPATYVADAARTTELTGWRPRYDLRAGIERTWDWFRSAGPALARTA
jgi:nucleoside-diphosphate-sugar epimerase